MIGYRVRLFCFLVGITAGFGERPSARSANISGRYTSRRTERGAYESTVATEMTYYQPEKGGKKGSKKSAYNHADYEYISGQDGHSDTAKGGKRGPGYGKGFEGSGEAKSGKGGKNGGVPTMSPGKEPFLFTLDKQTKKIFTLVSFGVYSPHTK